MGFFTLPMARLVGNEGKVIAVDVQQKMLDGLMRRARRAGLAGRIEPLPANSHGVTINQSVDFVAALHVVHELPDAGAFFRLMRNVMNPGAKMLVSEPGFHVTEADFQESLRIAAQAGFTRSAEDVAGRGRTAVLVAG
jgi:ubiquinone/menaquinone biosynthesis C-methylase UbiE